MSFARTNSHNNILSFDGLFATIVELYRDGVRTTKLTEALHVVGLILLEEVLDTTSKTGDSLGFVLHHCPNVYRNFSRHIDTMGFEIFHCVLVHVSRV